MPDLDLNELTSLKLLLNVAQLGPNRIKNLLSKFYNPQNILSSDFHQLIKTEGISDNLAKRIQNANRKRKEVEESLLMEVDKLEKIGGEIITILNERYPFLLKKIYDPPIILYKLGQFKKEDENSIAVVGTRRPSDYGRKQAEKLCKELVERNLTIVSGLARGIDSISHRVALKNSGRTVAVIGSGLDVIYPPENKKLFSEIQKNGVVLSEYSLGTKPDAMNFPKRNRIISGLSAGTVIIETGVTGGALHTASFALDQGREVFAIPGNVNAQTSEGTNRLIQKGEAKLITNVDDILSELNLKIDSHKKIKKSAEHINLNIFEAKIINVLNEDPTQIDKIAELTKLSTSDCLVHLLSLEFRGLVKQLPGKTFSLL